ncbi:MAG: YfhO family protein [Isosphaerales bacterium]
MRLRFPFILIIICFSALFLFCYAPAFFRDRQFGFRDAGHFYYPLNQRVQEEWNHGRWPLWEPEENAGMPLLGNPTAAVFYPGKLVFAVLPYAWGARVYVVGHTALAFAAMLVLMRSWGTSWVGSALGALAYTFGAPILFQYCNIIYLVGAAWLPLGMHAVDRWVRLGRRWGLVELAVVLAMQVLGGDPQAAYLLGLAGGGYALGMAWSRARLDRAPGVPDDGTPRAGFPLGLFVPPMLVLVLGWCAATVLVAMWLPKLREPHEGPRTPPFSWMLWMPLAVNAAWGLVAIGFLDRWRRQGWRSSLGTMWLGLASAAALAVALTAVQLLPVIEFTQQTVRAAGGGPHEMYPFSVEPHRLVEMAWPNVCGIHYEGNSYWAEAVQIPGVHPKMWVPSLYVGVLTVVLGCSALAFRNGPPWRVWLSAILVVSLLGSFGKYTSPILAARVVVATSKSAALEGLTADLGPLDAIDAMPIREDGFLRDGDGSFYWWLATVLPGFRQFRFPAKLFTFTALALAALAGLGWDRMCAGRTRGIAAMLTLLLLSSLMVFAGVVIERQPILAAFRASPGSGTFGPFDPAKGYQAIKGGLAHGGTVLAAGLILTLLVRRRPQSAGALALIVMTVDLAVANSRLVLTVPQSLFETKPEVLRIIEAEERARPAPGPFRIHRMPLWNPLGWNMASSTNRVLDLVAWERDTLQPKHGINLGVEYTHTVGVAELYDYEWYFNGFLRTVRSAEVAKSLGIEVGKEVVYYPRRAFDMWNTRYFVVPAYPNGWRDEMRGFASFWFQSKVVYPEQGRFPGHGDADDLKKWIETRDFRILRNDHEYPRAWVVHEARSVRPLEGLSRESRDAAVQEILYPQDQLWNDTTHVAFDPHQVAWLATDDLNQLRRHLSGRQSGPTETVKVSYPTPRRSVLEARLESPGLVILSDVYYPGWELTIDDKPATIYRVNGMMRGASVPAGTHRLVYTYAPRSFRDGGVISFLGMAALAILGLVCARRPVDRLLGGSNDLDRQEAPPVPDLPELSRTYP